MFNPQMIAQFKQFMNNPAAMMDQMGIPKDIQSNPQSALQYLMNTGRLSQAQYNQLSQTAKQFQSMLK